MKEATTVRLKENFFPHLIANLKTLDKRLMEETIDGEGYIELLNQGWKSFWILDFRKFYRSEEEALSSFKHELEQYEDDIQKFKNTGDEKLKNKTLKRKSHIQKNIPLLIKKLENLI
jgi:hypothetical protein